MISVILPIYNMEAYLQRCLDTIYSNTYKDLEIICVDDGSTDSSLEILKAQTDPRVKIIAKENGGVSTARNAGLDAATGEYIAFVDPDDWVHPQHFEALLDGIQDADLSHCGRESTLEYHVYGPIAISKRTIDAAKAVGIRFVKTYCTAKLFRKSTIGGLRFSETLSYGEDTLFVLQVLSRIVSVCVIDDWLYYYFVREGSLAHSSNADMLPYESECLKLAAENPNSIYLEIVYKSMLASRYSVMFRPEAKERNRIYREKLKECRKLASHQFSMKKRIVYAVMADFPPVYRAFRILTDRTLLQWEAEEKKKHRR